MESEKDKITQLLSDAVNSLKILMTPPHPSDGKCSHRNELTWASIVTLVVDNHNAMCAGQQQWCATDIQLNVIVTMPDSSHAKIPINYQDDSSDGSQKEASSIKLEPRRVVDSDEEDHSDGESMTDDEDVNNMIPIVDHQDEDSYAGSDKKEAVSIKLEPERTEDCDEEDQNGDESHDDDVNNASKVNESKSKENDVEMEKKLNRDHDEEEDNLKEEIDKEQQNKYVQSNSTSPKVSASDPNQQTRKTEFPCQICGKICETEETLKNHVQLDHKVEETKKTTFPCQFCKRIFNTQDFLKKHVQHAHKVKDVIVARSSSKKSVEIHVTVDQDVENEEEISLSCPQCSATFETEKRLKTHMKCHKNLKTYKCEMCGWKSTNKKVLVQHLKTHKDDSLQCSACEEIFHSAVYLNAHMMRNHTNILEEGPDPKQCRICKKIFSKEQTRKAHEMLHNKAPEMHKCHLCEKSFPLPHFLKAHMQAHEKNNTCNVCGEKFRFLGELHKHRKKVHQLVDNYVCDVCGATFARQTQYKEHENLHTREKTYLCDLCGKAFLHNSTLRDHMRQHRDVANRDKVPCTLCPKRFPSQKRLNHHVRNIHLQEKNHKCSYCDKAFFASFKLKIHEQMHTGDMDYKCPYCPKQFPTKRQFVNHKNSHLGVKPFQCTICLKFFSRENVLRRHVKAHTNTESKPEYPCKTCGVVLTTKGGLTQHEKRHFKVRNQVCDECGATFMFKADLIRHLKIHTDGKPYKCELCDMSFARRSDVTKHIVVHADTKDEQL